MIKLKALHDELELIGKGFRYRVVSQGSYELGEWVGIVFSSIHYSDEVFYKEVRGGSNEEVIGKVKELSSALNYLIFSHDVSEIREKGVEEETIEEALYMYLIRDNRREGIRESIRELKRNFLEG